MPDSDSAVRLAAFKFLDEQRQLHPEGLPHLVLSTAFAFNGTRVPLLGPQGIFKPKVCELPISIKTAPVIQGQTRPYDDVFGEDGLLQYRYRGTDPNHWENVALRTAMQRRTPLIYFHGIAKGLYEAAYPVFIVGDDPGHLTFTVNVDERKFVGLGNVPDPQPDTDIRRRYATRQVQQRLHQQEFRHRVLAAYRRNCAVCRLRRTELLEAAHIVADRDERGEPVVSNGIALCTLHHAAFDSHIIGVRPDYLIEVRKDVLAEADGPMLIHGLQGFHHQVLLLPRARGDRPDAELLEVRYALFRRAL